MTVSDFGDSAHAAVCSCGEEFFGTDKNRVTADIATHVSQAHHAHLEDPSTTQ